MGIYQVAIIKLHPNSDDFIRLVKNLTDEQDRDIKANQYCKLEDIIKCVDEGDADKIKPGISLYQIITVCTLDGWDESVSLSVPIIHDAAV
jgi:hypothetical protein